MIDLNETSVGDCIYALLTVQTAPVFAEVVKVLNLEGAVEVNTDLWGRRVILAQNAFWEEKEAKKGKLFKVEHNYKQWAEEYFRDEETEIDHRIHSLHQGTTESSESSRQDEGLKSVSKSPKRKSKVVRKSSTKERKTKRNRKPRSKKE